MTISRSHLFADFEKQRLALAHNKNELDQAKENLEFARKIKDEINQSLAHNYDFNWENDPTKRALLERLYDLEAFQDVEPIYHFQDPQKALELIQRIEHYHSDCVQNLELKKNIYAQKKSALDQRHSELINTIRQIGNAMASIRV